MLNVQLSYNLPNYWRIRFRSGGRPRQFSSLKYFGALVVPDGGWCKWIILKGGHLPSGLPLIGQSCLKIKGGVTEMSAHAPRQRNSPSVQTARWSIYETRWTEHPHSLILRYTRRPQGLNLLPRYKVPLNTKLIWSFVWHMNYFSIIKILSWYIVFHS